jgi:electron transfer flavoprotein beta subunit
MRVVVCIKQIGYVYHPIAINETRGHIDPEKMVFMLNPYDEIAVEEAIKIKENFNNCEVVIVTVGPPRAEEALRYAFAMGADKMIRIDYESCDSWLISMALAKIIKDLRCNLILCGKKAIDNNGNQVGSFIAELLDIPQVSGIVGLEILTGKKKAVIDRYLGKGDRQVVECNLPALFTVENGLNDPRYPSLPNRLLAEKKNIEVIDLNCLELCVDQGIDLTKFMTFSAPRPKPKKLFTPDSNLSASERMKLIMSGGFNEKKSDLLEGKAEHIANKIIQILTQEKLL